MFAQGGRSLHIELVKLHGSKGLCRDQRPHVPIQMTPTGQAHMQPVEAMLPLLDAWLRTDSMFKKQELSAPFQHAVDFPQGLPDILDAAQRERADDAIEGAVFEGEPLAAEEPLVNLDPCLLDPPSCPSVHAGIRLDARDFAHVGRVARQVQSGAKANFQNVAVGVGKQLPTIPGHERSIQTEIAEQWQDHSRIEAHRRLLAYPGSYHPSAPSASSARNSEHGHRLKS